MKTKRNRDMCAIRGFCQSDIPYQRRPKRARMPQLGTRRLQRRADALLGDHYDADLSVKELLFSQRDINRDRVDAIVQTMRKKKVKGKVPIVVFEHPADRFTVGDGHHRTAALKWRQRLGEIPMDATVPAHVYRMDPQQGLEILMANGFTTQAF